MILEQLKIRRFAWPIMVLGEARKQHSTRGSSLGSYSEIESNKQRKAKIMTKESCKTFIIRLTLHTLIPCLSTLSPSISIKSISSLCFMLIVNGPRISCCTEDARESQTALLLLQNCHSRLPCQPDVLRHCSPPILTEKYRCYPCCPTLSEENLINSTCFDSHKTLMK